MSPLYDVPDHTNHKFSESLSSGDDNDRGEDLQKDKYKDKDTQTKTNTKCFQDPTYAIFFKSRGFKDLKYYIGSLLVMTKTKSKTKTKIKSKTKTKCFQDPMNAIFYSKAEGARI